MYKSFALAFLVGGILFVFFGISASQSLGSDISRFFTNSPTDKAIWMLLIGMVLSIVGVVGMFLPPKASRATISN